MSNILKNNKGVVLIASYIVALILLVATGAFLTMTDVGTRVMAREKDTVKALYAAERGIESAFIESQYANWAWHTHRVDDKDADNDGDATELIRTADPGHYLDNFIYNNNTGCYEMALLPSGLIAVKTYPNPANSRETFVLSQATVGQGQKTLKFKLRRRSLYEFFLFFPKDFETGWSTYNGKGVAGIHANGNILLSGSEFQNLTELSCAGSIQRYALQYQSPYYWDYYGDGASDYNYNGSGPLPKHSYAPYYYLPWRGIVDRVDYHFYGVDPYAVRPWSDDSTVGTSWGGSTADPTTYSWVSFWVDTDEDGKKDSGESTYIPKILPNANDWQWDKYSWYWWMGTESPQQAQPVEFNITNDALNWMVEIEEGDNEYNPSSSALTVLNKAKQIPIGSNNYSEYQLYRYAQGTETIPGGNAALQTEVDKIKTQGYWSWWQDRHKTALSGDSANIAGWKRQYWEARFNWQPGAGQTHQTGPDWTNQEWWEDLKYGSDYAGGGETKEVNFLHSGEQVEAWKEWLNGAGLEGKIQEKSTGGKYEIPIDIEANYVEMAKTSGLYIGKDEQGRLDVWLNGQETDKLPDWVRDNVQFYNPTYTKVDSNNRAILENVLELNISAMDEPPNNGIIYVAKRNTRLVKGEKLPPGGLTFVSPYDVYLKGNYNTDTDWQPAAVITNSLVYTLSDDFKDRTDIFPLATDYKEYPYSLEFQEDFLDKYCAGSRYPAGLPKPAGQLTWDWIKANLTSDQQVALRASGENYYDEDNHPNKSNVVTKDTTYRVAIASPYDPHGYLLERWDYYVKGGKYYEQYMGYQYGKRIARTIEGAFIQLNSSWANDNNGNPIRNTPYSTWYGRLARGTTKGWGGYYAYNSPYYRRYEYEEQFTVPGGTPPGDLSAGSAGSWQFAYDFEHHQ